MYILELDDILFFIESRKQSLDHLNIENFLSFNC